MVGIVALTWGTTASAGTHEIHRGQLKSQRDARPVPSAAVRPDIHEPAKASPLGIAKVRLDPPPPGEKENSAVLKFQMSNGGANTLTDIVLEVVIVEEREREHPYTPNRVIAGPFVIRGRIVLDPGYTADFKILLRHISPTCRCAANVRVLSFRSIGIQARNGGFRLRLLKSDVRVSVAMMRALLLQVDAIPLLQRCLAQMRRPELLSFPGAAPVSTRGRRLASASSL